MGAIFKKELRSYFVSPLGYIFLAIMWAFSGYYFTLTLSANLSYIQFVFGQLFTIIMFVIPLLTMRLLSEDKKLKTDQLLFTSPVNLNGIVWGKYFAALIMFLIGIGSTIFFVIILSTFTVPDWNVFLGNFLATALLGGALISIGLFISSTTESQIVAAILSFTVTILLTMLDGFIAQLPVFFASILKQISFLSRYNDFVSGILNISHVIFFVSVIVVFNFLTVRLLERKRWS